MGFHYILPSLILSAGVVDDLRSRKVHNWLSMSLLAIAAVAVLISGGFSGLMTASLGVVILLAVLAPLVLLGVIGGGDMKLMLAFTMATSWQIGASVLLYSLVWGALFGVDKVLASHPPSVVLAKLQHPTQIRLNADAMKIPYTVALLLGWLTYTWVGSVFGGLI